MSNVPRTAGSSSSGLQKSLGSSQACLPGNTCSPVWPLHLRAFSIPPTAPAALAQGSARQSEFSDTDIWLCSLLDLIRVRFQSR